MHMGPAYQSRRLWMHNTLIGRSAISPVALCHVAASPEIEFISIFAAGREGSHCDRANDPVITHNVHWLLEGPTCIEWKVERELIPIVALGPAVTIIPQLVIPR